MHATRRSSTLQKALWETALNLAISLAVNREEARPQSYGEIDAVYGFP